MSIIAVLQAIAAGLAAATAVLVAVPGEDIPQIIIIVFAVVSAFLLAAVAKLNTAP
mgnify:CR=1 FL=1